MVGINPSLQVIFVTTLSALIFVALCRMMFQPWTPVSSGRKYSSAETDSKELAIVTSLQNTREVTLLSERLAMLEKLNFDQFGPTDYAAHRFGGEVMSVSSHIPGANDTLMQKFQNMLPSFTDNQKQCIVQNCGTCYAIPGSKGSVVIRLMNNIWLRSITVEHFPRHAYPRSEAGTYSAMNEFEVWGTNDPSDPKTDLWYGNFRFDFERDFLETFNLRQHPAMQSVRYVRVNILSNHGQEYTCIYRIRVHGTPEN